MVRPMDVGDATGPGPGCLRKAGYELVCRLGEGGMGEVWAGARLGLEGAIKPCAIKVIRPAYADDEQYRRLFVAEGRVAMMLGHANIVSVFDVGVVDELLFMAMDWVDGVDLGTFRSQVQLSAGRRPLAVDDAVHIVGGLLDALAYAHDFSIAGREHGIVHRDVSPGNVMITSRGEVKLMDFGLAGLDRSLDGAPHEGTGPRFRGTLRYLSREQARGRPGPASDLFAVGAILHELLDGRKFRHWCTDDEALVAEIFDGGIPPLERRVPAPIEALRRALLEPRVELRVKTARRALAMLAAWPGYRNRRLFLEALYRQVFGEPRSGLTQLLSLGVRSELLDELRRRVEAGRMVTTSRSRLDHVGHVEAPVHAAEPSPDAVVRARRSERVSAHRVAQGPSPGLDEDPAEQEITEPWPRSRPDGPSVFDESPTAWLVPSSPGGAAPSLRLGALGALGMDALAVAPPWLAPRMRLALLMVLAAVLGGLSTLVVVGVRWASEGMSSTTAAVVPGGRS